MVQRLKARVRFGWRYSSMTASCVNTILNVRVGLGVN